MSSANTADKQPEQKAARKPKFTEGVSRRRAAREWAVQLLFQYDMNPSEPDKLFAEFWSERKVKAKDKAFTEELVRGALAEKAVLDEWISRCAKNWEIKRMPATDRNVLRLGVYEVLRRKDIPVRVSINEAVDLARYFGTRGSGKFINGILDRVRKECGRDVEKPASVDE